jgi:hypothetical protein
MPRSRPSPRWLRTAQKGGYLPLATGVCIVRYPIPQRTFKYVATVQSLTDETCQLLTSDYVPGLALIRKHLSWL